jgi:hypothetical protein
VPSRKEEAAASLARELNGEARAVLRVVTKPVEMPWLKLIGPPRPPASDLLSDIVEALVGDSDDVGSLGPETLERLSWVPPSERERPILRRRRPASFLLLSPTQEGMIDPETTRLTSVFIDGLDVKGDSK